MRRSDDIYGNVESLYNLAHETLAIQTFRAIAAGLGYAFITMDLSLINDYDMLRNLYRSYIYGYLKEQADRNEKGSVQDAIARNNAYRRRSQVLDYQDCRTNWLTRPAAAAQGAKL